jgi:tRNA-specific 2-thiouridylase
MAMKRTKVLVAMSGGVDSSVAAALLLREGYDVVGCFMRLGSPGDELDTPIPADQCDTPRLGSRGCCSVGDAADARLVAAQLGIPLYVCNFKQDFSRIIDYFVDEYVAGRTPNPCIRCNDWLKFGKLHDYATQIGADYVASGHYARIGRMGTPPVNPDPSGTGILPVKPDPCGTGILPVIPRLLRGLDHTKDQSYVLFGVPRERLGRMMLPIGEYKKSRVRELAREFDLPVHDKPDSQEICFVPDDDYAGLIERRRPETVGAGDVLDPAGNVVGRHAGQHRFTIGQRRGVAVALGYPVYVVKKDPAANTVTVGPRDMLRCDSCTVGEANWLVDPPASDDWHRCFAKYRYNTLAVGAEYRVLDGSAGGGDQPGGLNTADQPTPSGRRGSFEVRFDEPRIAVTPGQALVLHDAADPDAVIGGGWIDRVQRSDA